jgi:hypothetical protein
VIQLLGVHHVPVDPWRGLCRCRRCSEQTRFIRKADREGLADLGFSDATTAKLFTQHFADRVGFPNYAHTSNSANIRQLEKRLAARQNTQHDETKKEQFASGVRLVDNVEANSL